MARYKAIDTSPRFLAVDLEKQLLPGSFEHAVHHLLEREFDLSIRYPLSQRPERRHSLPAGHAAQGHPLRLRARRRQQPGHRTAMPRTRHLHCALG